MSRQQHRVRVGISGWRYKPWRGVFYPRGLPQRRELEYAAQRLDTIELNGSFYSLQRPTSYLAWVEQTPEDFVFAVKGSRFLTHLKRLRDPEPGLANFFASGVLALGPKLGPVLWQLPPRQVFDPEQLTGFFDALPRTTAAAAALAERHDERVKDRVWTTTDADRPIQHVLEVRHPTFEVARYAALLREHDIGIVIADAAGLWPEFDDVTSDVVYVRLHGDQELYVSGYGGRALDRWADRIRGWAERARRLRLLRQRRQGARPEGRDGPGGPSRCRAGPAGRLRGMPGLPVGGDRGGAG